MSDNVLFSIERQFPEELAGELCEFFGHKGWPYEDCIRDFLEHGSEGEREGLEWRFYLARADGRPVSNICTWEHRGIGILGHVYTRPEWRQKGLAKRLFALQMKDFAERDGREMYLNVMPGSVAHRLYRSLGYEDIDGKPGGMVWRRGVAGSPS
jgi:GNAT superfamily N-acetyltransferase